MLRENINCKAIGVYQGIFSLTKLLILAYMYVVLWDAAENVKVHWFNVQDCDNKYIGELYDKI